MKKFDIASIFFGVFLTVVALIFMLRSSASKSAPSSSIPTVQIGNVIWDQTEMNIADVKVFSSSTGFVSVAEKKRWRSLL